MRLLQQLAQVKVDTSKDVPNIPQPELTSTTLNTVLQFVFGLLGAIAVFIIVYAGFRLAISRSNPEATAQARNTIIYALIGLVICLIAFSIVTFVVNKV